MRGVLARIPFPGRFVLVLAVLGALLYGLERINGRFWLNDFRVYYGAAQALLNGEPLYGVAHGLGTGFFKYAPAAALLFVPVSLLPYKAAASLHFALVIAAFIGSALAIDRLLRQNLFPGRPAAYAPLFLTALAAGAHLHRELHLGNVNAMLLWLLMAGLERLLSGRHRSAGALLGLAVALKPHFVVLLPWLLLRRRWSALAMALTLLVAAVALPTALLGPSASLQLHGEWLAEMARHNASLIHTGGTEHENVNTIYSFLHRAVLQRIWGAPLAWEAPAILAAIALAFGLLMLRHLRLEAPGGERSRNMAFEALLLIALVPNITLTDTEHFLFAMPLVAYLIQGLRSSERPRWLRAAGLLVLLGHGGNWGDALGPMADVMVHYGILGAANGALLFLAAGLHAANPSPRSNHGLRPGS